MVAHFFKLRLFMMQYMAQGNVTAQNIIDFQLSLNRVPPTASEANIYLSKMVGTIKLSMFFQVLLAVSS